MKNNVLNAGLALVGSLAMAACGPGNPGTPGDASVTRPAITGTVFTIVFENHDEGQVINTSVPYFYQLSQQNGSARAYISNTHPSLPNYIMMTSGDIHGIADDLDPASHPIAGNDNLGDQLDAAHVPWRAYMESMGDACKTVSDGTYAARHNPFVYYTSMTNDTTRCRDHIVDFDQNFANDLAANTYKYMWISPNTCNDMHDCSAATADAWLQRVVTQIQASPGYQNGGAIFILFDEGSLRILNAAADLPTIVLSPRLVAQPYESQTRFDHRSYLATMEDIFGLPRLTTTVDATPMSEFFTPAGSTTNAP